MEISLVYCHVSTDVVVLRGRLFSKISEKNVWMAIENMLMMKYFLKEDTKILITM